VLESLQPDGVDDLTPEGIDQQALHLLQLGRLLPHLSAKEQTRFCVCWNARGEFLQSLTRVHSKLDHVQQIAVEQTTC
jgi:hypothetical protein